MPNAKTSRSGVLGTPTTDLSLDERGLTGRALRSKRARCGALVTVVYSFLAFVLYWNAWTSDPTKWMPPGGGDTTLTAWFLTWSPFAVFNAHNPFLTNWINYPFGVNLTQNASMPLLGLLAAPVTATFGPIASMNLLLTASFAASAGTGYLLVRRWTSWRPAAFIGGLLVGFSPYMVAQGGAHLHLVFVPLIPLMILVLDEILVRQRGQAASWGLALALLVVAQFFVSSELLADTAVFGLIGVATLAAFNPSVARAHFRYAALALTVTAAAAGIVLAYPIWVALAGPQHYVGPAQGAFTHLYRADLFGFLSPTPRQLIHPTALSLASDTSGGFAFKSAPTSESPSSLSSAPSLTRGVGSASSRSPRSCSSPPTSCRSDLS